MTVAQIDAAIASAQQELSERRTNMAAVRRQAIELVIPLVPPWHDEIVKRLVRVNPDLIAKLGPQLPAARARVEACKATVAEDVRSALADSALWGWPDDEDKLYRSGREYSLVSMRGETITLATDFERHLRFALLALADALTQIGFLPDAHQWLETAIGGFQPTSHLAGQLDLYAKHYTELLNIARKLRKLRDERRSAVAAEAWERA